MPSTINCLCGNHAYVTLLDDKVLSALISAYEILGGIMCANLPIIYKLLRRAFRGVYTSTSLEGKSISAEYSRRHFRLRVLGKHWKVLTSGQIRFRYTLKRTIRFLKIHGQKTCRGRLEAHYDNVKSYKRLRPSPLSSCSFAAGIQQSSLDVPYYVFAYHQIPKSAML
jgi:hypothetical protein